MTSDLIDEENSGLKAVRRYAPESVDEQRRAFVVVMVLGDSDSAANGKQVVEKMAHIEQYLRDGHKMPEQPRGLKVV